VHCGPTYRRRPMRTPHSHLSSWSLPATTNRA
jgi:hypothetical protein